MTADTVALIAFAWLGLSVGSFLNVCIHRLPRRTSVVRPSSRCPNCDYELRWFDNIPVLSWLTLRGAAGSAERRSASAPDRRDPHDAGVPAALVGVRLDSAHGRPLLFACALIALFAIDLEHHLLPDKITLPGIATA